MANIKESLAASAAITATLASLASGSARESAAVDNSSNLYTDALVTLAVKTGASGVSSTGYVSVYAAGSEDGTIWQDTATGADAAITLTSPTNLRLIGTINAVANATTYKNVFSVAQAFNGVLPRKWSIVVINNTGAALDATEGSFTKSYTGVSFTVA